MDMKAAVLFLFLAWPAVAACEGASFKDFINDSADGATFQQAIVIKDTADYGACKDKACLVSAFNESVFGQELDYVSSKYGVRGRNWEVSGFDAVDAYTLASDKFYDDLGVDLFSSGKKIVIHFDITSPVHALRGQKYY